MIQWDQPLADMRRLRVVEGWRIREIAKKYGVAKSDVGRLIARKTTGHENINQFAKMARRTK
jgi:hypothetical protein